jgi:hypothetical protein
MNLSRHHRCGQAGGWLYLHEIRLDWSRFGIAPE